MADIFISYSREDREWVSKLAEAIQAEGFTVWWDWDLLVGKRYRETIETELQTCKATLVVWSQHSVRSDFVRDEAEEGQQRNILVPILKESVRPPAGFRQLQTADFSTWTGGTTHAEYQRMIKGLSHLIGRPGASAPDHVDAAPAPVAPAPEPVHPAPMAEPAPAPVVPPTAAVVAPAAAPIPHPVPLVQAKAPEPPVHTPVVNASAPPKHGMPVIGYVAIGVVALVALLAIAVALFPNNSPPPKPLTPAHPPTTPVDGTSPTTPAHPSGTPTPPVTTPPGEPADEAGNSHGGSSSGAGHPSNSDATPPAPPQPPAGDGGDTGQDVGQAH
jgi:hypothetical protein